MIIHVCEFTGQGAVPLLRHRASEVGCPYHGKLLEKSKNEMAITYEKNEVTPPGFEPGTQIRMIQRVTSVPRSLANNVSLDDFNKFVVS